MNSLPLEEVANIFSGNSINAKLKKDKYTDKNFPTPYVATKDLSKNGDFEYNNGVTIPDAELGNFKIAPKGSTLICMEGGSAGKKIGLIDKDVCFVNKLGALVPNEKIYSKYLYYSLQTVGFQAQFQSSLTGIIGGVSLSKLKKLKIPVSSLQEQEKVVEKIEKVFKTIDRLLSNAALMKKLYIDYFESITWNELIENPNFPKNPISNFFELDPSKSEIADENLKDVSFIPMADVKELSFQVESKQVKNFEKVKKGYKYFADGDFVLAKITPCFENGKMGEVNNLVNGIGFGSTEFIVHRSNGKMLNEWLFLIYSNTRIREKLAMTMSGAVGHKRVSKETISNFQINSPDLNQQKKVIDKLFEVKQAIDKKISVFNQEIINLELLKKSILNKEFAYE